MGGGGGRGGVGGGGVGGGVGGGGGGGGWSWRSLKGMGGGSMFYISLLLGRHRVSGLGTAMFQDQHKVAAIWSSPRLEASKSKYHPGPVCVLSRARRPTAEDLPAPVEDYIK